MKILMLVKYPPIQGGVSADSYWTAQLLAEMGHEVHVVTNAMEVEEGYRITLNKDDKALLNGYRIPNSIFVHGSYVDKKHIFIPQNNPSLSKLVGISLALVEKVRPDFIWAYYIEPYGVAALLISKLTGIPYLIRHAGSDIGRLMLTEQLSALYKEVFRNSIWVLTHHRHFDRFRDMEISEDKLYPVVSPRLPSDLFYPEDFNRGRDKLVLGVYGKTGPAKGTVELLQAMAILKKQGFPCVLKAHWGGRYVADALEMITRYNLGDTVEINGFIPHWKIPDFIRDCDVIMFLENRFGITFHGPGIPLESLSCGRPIIVTKEIGDKETFKNILKVGQNCLMVPLPLTKESIAEAIKSASIKIKQGGFDDVEWPDNGLLNLQVRKGMEDLLQSITKKE